MKDLWSTSDLMAYYNKSASQIKAWRNDGLKSTMLSGAYYYEYKDIVEYLGELK